MHVKFICPGFQQPSSSLKSKTYRTILPPKNYRRQCTIKLFSTEDDPSPSPSKPWLFSAPFRGRICAKKTGTPGPKTGGQKWPHFPAPAVAFPPKFFFDGPAWGVQKRPHFWVPRFHFFCNLGFTFLASVVPEKLPSESAIS